MTYFTRDDNGPYDLMTELEHDAWHEIMVTAANHGQEIGCLYPDDHDPRHPKDMRFHVNMQGVRDPGLGWEDLTEVEMEARYRAGATGALLSSMFDFWWE